MTQELRKKEISSLLFPHYWFPLCFLNILKPWINLSITSLTKEIKIYTCCCYGNAMTTTSSCKKPSSDNVIILWNFPIRGKTHQEITDSHFSKEKQLHPPSNKKCFRRVQVSHLPCSSWSLKCHQYPLEGWYHSFIKSWLNAMHCSKLIKGNPIMNFSSVIHNLQSNYKVLHVQRQ